MSSVYRWLSVCASVSLISAFGVASITTYKHVVMKDDVLAFAAMQQALSALDDPTTAPDERATTYGRALAVAEKHLERLLRSHPADTVSIERLATVRWELGAFRGDPDAVGVASLIDLAATRAPRITQVQVDLGALSYKLGRFDEADNFMLRAVDLSPASTNRVVATMLDAGLSPASIMAALPITVELLVALKEPVARGGDWTAWLDSAEPLITKYPKSLLIAYTDACVAARALDRLLSHVDSMGALTDPVAETHRQLAIARAQLDRNQTSLAADAAAKAAALSPLDPLLLELIGEVSLLSGDHAGAERTFRRALIASTSTDLPASVRARFYRRRGQALEGLGQVGDAFDDYRRSAELDPSDTWIRERLALPAATGGS